MTAYRHDALAVGHLLNNNTYRIERVLGSGAFGITYLAQHVLLGSQHVIKEYIPDTATRRAGTDEVVAKSNGDEELFRWGLDSFFHEAQLLHRLNHPNVVKVNDLFEANGTAYFVMPYLGSTTLLDWIQANPKPQRADLDKIFVPLLEGLKYIHAQDLLHRDIKPANILLAQEGQPILIDFGSARMAVGGRSRPLTQILTPGFAPVEQYSNKGPYTPALDLYGLSACLYQAVTGDLPEEAVNRLQQDPYQPLAKSVYAKYYPTHWLAAIDKGLSVHARDRFQDAFEMQKALMGQSATATAAHTQVREAAPVHVKGKNKNKDKHQAYAAASSVPEAAETRTSGCLGSLMRFGLIGVAAAVAAYGYFVGANKQAAENGTSDKPYRGEIRITVGGKGATFSGRIENGKANDSNGKLVFDDGTVCEGSIINNKREGTVLCRYPKGSVYNGTWKNDQKHGEGEYTMSKASPAQSYRGGYVRGKLHGQGVIVYKNGASYEGEFANDRIMGKGAMTGMKDAPLCQGEFNQAKNIAVCSYREDGLTFHYTGGFKNALWEGKGTLVRLNGKVEAGRSEGRFKQGELVEETLRPVPAEETETIETESEENVASQPDASEPEVAEQQVSSKSMDREAGAKDKSDIQIAQEKFGEVSETVKTIWNTVQKVVRENGDK